MDFIGNKSLLYLPKYGFLCSRCTKSSVILPCLDWAVERAKGEDPVISTFHSEIEKAVLDMLIPGKCPVILVLGRSIYKKIPENLQRLLDANRLLIISVCDQKRISKESAFLSNQYICQNSQSLTFGFISKESALFSLYNESRNVPSHLFSMFE